MSRLNALDFKKKFIKTQITKNRQSPLLKTSVFEEGVLLANLIDYYNNKRIKQKLAGMSPFQYRIHTSQLTA
jgi:hypothetical protein